MSTFTDDLTSGAVHDGVVNRGARIGLGVVAFAVATAFGAQVAVPLPWTPIPVTMQPLLIILAGVALGPRFGALSMAAYVGVGALGAPVFSNGGAGLAWLFGPTGGYLLAAPAAAFVAGALAGRDGSALRLLAGLVLGTATLYLGGVTQLLALTGESFTTVVAMGVTPFLVGDVTKILVAFFGVHAIRRAHSDRS